MHRCRPGSLQQLHGQPVVLHIRVADLVQQALEMAHLLLAQDSEHPACTGITIIPVQGMSFQMPASSWRQKQSFDSTADTCQAGIPAIRPLSSPFVAQFLRIMEAVVPFGSSQLSFTGQAA